MHENNVCNCSKELQVFDPEDTSTTSGPKTSAPLLLAVTGHNHG
jgi:hypothetical protein